MTAAFDSDTDNEFLYTFLWRLMCLGAVGTRYIQTSLITNTLPNNCIKKALQALRYLILHGFVLTKTSHSLEEISLNQNKVEEVKLLIRRMGKLDDI